MAEAIAYIFALTIFLLVAAGCGALLALFENITGTTLFEDDEDYDDEDRDKGSPAGRRGEV